MNIIALLVIICYFVASIVAPSMSHAANENSIADDIRKQQQQNRAMEIQRIREEAEDSGLELRLNEIVKPYFHDVFLGLKKSGVEFDEAAPLFERIKSGKDSGIELHDLENLSREFVNFRSYTFLSWIRYDGAFSIAGTNRLFASHGWMKRDYDGRCVYYAEIRILRPIEGFEQGGWESELQDFPCDRVLSGKAAKDIKHFMLSAIHKVMKK